MSVAASATATGSIRRPLARYALGVGAMIAAGAVLRWWGMFNDLWLDEVWTLGMVADLHSPEEILTRLRHNNNHPLNSLFMYLLWPTSAEWTYRLLSWVTGVFSICLAAAIGRRQFHLLEPDAGADRGRVAGLAAAALFAACYLLVHYASEARGYSPAVCFSLVALYALMRGDGQQTSPWAYAYWAACALAVLSHLVAMFTLAAGAAWSLAGAVWSQPRRSGVELCWWQAVPVTFFCVFYFLFVRTWTMTGGNDAALVPVLEATAAYTLGWPVSWFPPLVLLLSSALAALGLVRVQRHRPLLFFYITAMVIAPAAALLVSGVNYLYPRYFIVSAMCLLLLMAHLAASAFGAGGIRRWGSLAMLGAFVMGNGAHTALLLQQGRGQYRAALRYMLVHTAGPEVVIGSDHDFRNLALIQHHLPAVLISHPMKVRYANHGDWPPGGVDWYFVHRLDDGPEPAADLYDERQNRYRLQQSFPHAALSGWDWYLYRRESPAR